MSFAYNMFKKKNQNEKLFSHKISIISIFYRTFSFNFYILKSFCFIKINKIHVVSLVFQSDFMCVVFQKFNNFKFSYPAFHVFSMYVNLSKARSKVV